MGGHVHLAESGVCQPLAELRHVPPRPKAPARCKPRMMASWRQPAPFTTVVPRRVPPGQSTRTISARAAGGSGKQWRLL